MKNFGFTLLEVMIAAALLSIVTAGAMAAFLAQSRATNTQQQTTNANDDAREAIRVIANDTRSAAAGTTVGSGGFAVCDQGTIPFDGAGSQVACLPPVFRSNTPLILPTTIFGHPTSFPPSCGNNHPGYQLSYSTLAATITVPTGGDFFCPDDLVVLAVDDTNPLFAVQNAPGFSSAGNVQPITFSGTLAGTAATTRLATGSPAGAGYGFDDSTPATYLAPAPGCGLATPYCEPMMLIGGASGAVLLNAIIGGGSATWPAGGPPGPSGPCAVAANCAAEIYPIIPSTPAAGVDLFRNNLTFGSVALPARLTRYAIEPVDANGTPSTCTADPCVSANLIRSQIVPQTAGTTTANPSLSFVTLSSSVLVQGVVDMQVEFGIATPAGLVYVNSGGLQSAVWTPPTSPTYPGGQPSALTPGADNCNGGPIDPGVWSGVCFPTGGANGMNAIANLRTVRLNLTIRSGLGVSTRQTGASEGAAAVGAIYNLQPGVQDLSPNGNSEARQWGFNTATAFVPIEPLDGASYRQVSTEIYVRNLGWNNNL